MTDSYADHLANGQEPDSLDKEFLRLWVNERCDPYTDPIPEIPPETLILFSGKYIRLYELVTGHPFQKPKFFESVRDRVERNLHTAFPGYFSCAD